MAFFDCHFFSETLAMTVSAYVILPQATSGQVGMTGNSSGSLHPTLYLLHGLSDDHTIWLRRTSIERYAAEKGLAVVMPAASRSFYQDMANGARYWTFMSEELPSLMRRFFPLSSAREDNFVAGLSMGGYGALRLALSKPECFAAGASFSGALDLVRRGLEAGREGSRISLGEWHGILGENLDLKGKAPDLWHLAVELARSAGNKPALYVACGSEDDLLPESRAFRDHLDSLSLSLTYLESPGNHEWGYWDEQIRLLLNWLPLRLPKP